MPKVDHRIGSWMGAVVLGGVLVACQANDGGPTVPFPVVQLDLFPDHGPMGTQVRIAGEGLIGPSGEWPSVTFDGVPAEIIGTLSGAVITTVPDGGWTNCTGLEVRALRPDGSVIGLADFAVTSPWGFTILVDEVSPAEGPPGTAVTLRGQGLLGDLGPEAVEVSFGGIPAEVLEVHRNRIECVAPAGHPAGTSVSVQVSHSESTSCPGEEFTYP